MTPEFVADCGHLIPALPLSHVGGAGYATIEDKGMMTMCYPCCDAYQREAMKTAKSYNAYFSGDKSFITSWTGGKLATVTYYRSAAVGFGHNPRRYYIRAITEDGARWYGTSPGPGMFCRLRRAKGRERDRDTKPPQCSVCRAYHGREIVHECE